MEDKIFVIKNNEKFYYHSGSTFVESELDAHCFSNEEEANLTRNKVTNKFGIDCVVEELKTENKKIYHVKIEVPMFVEAYSKKAASQIALKRLPKELSKARIDNVSELNTQQK
jgi:hypothetical protein